MTDYDDFLRECCEVYGQGYFSFDAVTQLDADTLHDIAYIVTHSPLPNPKSPLGRLSRALTSATPQPPPSPTAAPLTPTQRRSDAPLSDVPVAPVATQTPPTPKTKPRVKHPHQSHNLTATLPDGTTKTQSGRAWERELGLSPATLRYRQRRGWSDMEVLGLASRLRDYAAEQASSAKAISNVVVVEDVLINGVVTRRDIPRPEAARRLNIKKNSLVHKLRDYRAPDGSQVEVELKVLMERRGR